jgi:hypothetical protein
VDAPDEGWALAEGSALDPERELPLVGLPAAAPPAAWLPPAWPTDGWVEAPELRGGGAVAGFGCAACGWFDGMGCADGGEPDARSVAAVAAALTGGGIRKAVGCGRGAGRAEGM